MKNIIFISLLFLTFGACKNSTSSNKETTKVYEVANGKVIFNDKSEVSIPDFDSPNHSVFIMVRHAEKKLNEGDDPTLTLTGETRAGNLGHILKRLNISQILSTNTRRTISTIQPLMDMTGKKGYMSYEQKTQNSTVESLIYSSKGQKFVLVGHSNTIPELLNHLTNTTNYKEIDSNEYSKFFVVVTQGKGQTQVYTFNY